MNSWIDLMNFSTAIAGLILVGLILIFVLFERTLDKWTRTYFLWIITVLFFNALSELVTQIALLSPGRMYVAKAGLFFQSLLASILMPLLTRYLLHCCREDWRRNRLIILVFSLWLLYFTLLCYTQFSTQIYYFTPDNVYHRGPWYPVLLVPAVAIMGINVAAVIRRRKKLSAKQFAAFLLYFLVPLIAMLIQMRFYGLHVVVFSTVCFTLLLYIFVLIDQMGQHARTMEENARQRASLMVLQMRPHFIYNTMTSIYYLCRQDAEKAQQVILDFTTYLRKNFTAIAQEETIPFDDELEHTRAYLAVEQVRFEGRLFVDIDTPHTQFRLPSLTLQPIVENAVKYGVDPELEPLHIAIRTRRTEGGSEVVVEDTGPGYEPASDDGPHIALPNIRERLEMLCRGRLEIAPRPGGGTVVTLFIPSET